MISYTIFGQALGVIQVALEDTREAGDAVAGSHALIGGVGLATLAVITAITVLGPLRVGQPHALLMATLPFLTIYVPTALVNAQAGLLASPLLLALRVLGLFFFGSAALITACYTLGLLGAPPHRIQDARLATGDSWRSAAREEWEYAISAAERAVALCPGCWGSHEALANAYIGTGRVDDARDAYERGLELCPDDVTLLARLAALDTDSGHYEQAARSYERLLEVGYDTGAVHYSLATVYLQLGRTTEAREQAKRALELVPGDAAAEQLLKINPY